MTAGLTLAPKAGLCWPQPVKKGEALGVFAPSGHFDPQRVAKGLGVLLDMGFSYKLPPDLDSRQDYLAGTDQHRLSTMRALMEDPQVGALVAVRGGYGAMRLLPELRKMWKKWPGKAIVGFSDLTALHLARFKATGLIGGHGPVLNSLAELDYQSQADFAAFLRNPAGSFKWTFRQGQIRQKGEARGPLLGGNLTLLAHLLAGPYLPDFTGAILLLEDVGEESYRLDRLLTGLTQSRLWSKISGLVLGGFTDCGDQALVERILDDRLKNFKGPVVFGAPFGHGQVNRIWPLGATAQLVL